MYYDKRSMVGGGAVRKIVVRDFSAGINGNKDEERLSPGECVFSYNFALSGGTLKDAGGVKKADFGGKCPKFDAAGVTPERLYYYKRYNETTKVYDEFLMIYGSDHYVYKAAMTDDAFSKMPALNFESAPTAVPYNYDGKDVMIFSCAKNYRVYNGSTVTLVGDVPQITSACIHAERLFATEGGSKTSLWFSDDFNPLNWKVSLDDAGFIDIREGIGSLVKVLSFGGYVYVFGLYGIVRVTAYGDQTEFSVDGIAASSGKIFDGSIAVCGDRIIYLAEDGFYSFSGGTPTRIMSKLDEKLAGIDNSDAKGVYFGGAYYCKMTMTTDCGVLPVLLKYDVHRRTFVVMRGLNVKDFAVRGGETDSELLLLVKGKNYPATLSGKGECFSVPLQKKWVSGKSDFGTTETKRVTRLALRTITDVDVTVESERGSRLLHFSGSKERQSLPIGLKGDSFTITVECGAAGASVSALEIEYEI